ncbi:PAS domain S-box-containing protein [Desulfobotulus alkaliphilus]|uniref:Sensory/regulatory protein RpfC n=1 Tax=Desulfobotulus alkaliphilus TaxID=622671 RepID=A0A562R468_9BACT|nr:PAS domain S-box protein [Desulfobotulus alkaliphilus]TWI63374.1 PAS domain S-box-containing protein [Desulfobotulus alkaliphilus]
MAMKPKKNRLKPKKISPKPTLSPWLAMAGGLILLLFTISTPVQAEEKTLSNDQRLKALSMASFEAIFLSEKGICIEQNQSAETMFGYTLDEARGRPGTDWITPIDRPMVMEKMMSGYGGAYEVRALRKDGTEFYAEIQGRMIEVGGRQIRVTALRDISDRKKMEAKMAASTRVFKLWLFGVIFLLLVLSTGLFFSILQRKKTSERLKERTWALESIFKSARTVSLIKTGLDSIVEEFSSGAEEIFGYTREEMVGRHVGILHTEAESLVLKKYVARLVQGEGFTIETELVRKDGSLFPALFSVQPVYDINGIIASTLGISFDISELKTAESALRRSELKYRLLFENMNAAFALHEMIYDKDGRPVDYRFIEINPMFEKLTGASREMITGRTVKEVMPETEAYWIETFGQVCLTGQPISYENYSKGIGRHFDTFAFSPEKDHFAVFFVDITDKKKAEKELFERERYLNTLVSNTPAVIYTYTIIPDGNIQITYINENLRNILGFEPEVFMDNIDFWAECVHPEDMAYLKEKLEGNELTVQYRFKNSQGAYRWLHDTQKILKKTDESIEIIGTWWDISEKKEAEAELSKSQKNLDMFFSQSFSGFFFMMLDEPLDWKGADEQEKEKLLDYTMSSQKMTKVNQAMLDQYGAKEEDFIGLTPQDLFAHDIEHGREIWKGLFEKGRWHVETKEQKLDGTPMIVDGDYICLYDDEGRITGHFGVQLDVARQRQAEEELKTSEERFNRAISGTGAGLWDWDMIKNTVYFSPQWKKMLGYDDHEISNAFSGWRQLWHPDDASNIEKAIKDYLDGKSESYEVEHRLLNKEGKWQWILTRGEIEKDSSGRPIRWTGTNIDITGRKRAEEALKIAKEEAEAGNAAKGEFLANMSHEIRTPLNAVIGLSRLMADTPLNTQQHNWLEKINRSSRLLLGIINDILDYSKIDAGKLELDYQPFTLKDITEEIKTLFKDAAEEKGLELVLSVCPEIPRIVRGDSLRLMQVLNNLLSNAIKFTPKGFVALSIGQNFCSAEEKREHIHTAQSTKGFLFSVEDSGIGMDKDQMKKLFQPFSQADTSTTRQFGGTGLGLVISKKLVEAMGGELSFHSAPGKGSTFFFYLSLEEASSERGIADKPENLREKMRFLVVDDQKPARAVLRKILESWNASVHEAGSGMEALEAVITADKSEQPFDFILMDWKMPGELDGLGAIKKLHELYTEGILKGPESPVFVISAYNREELPPEKPLFKAFLSKPVTASDLFDAMAEALGNEKLPVITQKKGQNIPSLSGYRILLVEDNALNQEVATRFIEKTGASVIHAENGLKAIEMTEHEKPDLILMDLQMPVMDGFEATRKIREMEGPDARALPIIALSAAVMENDRMKSREAGTSGHLAKPIDEAELYRTLAGLLEPKGWINEEKPVNDVNHFPELNGFNRKRAMSASLGDRAFYLKMLRSFARQLEEVFIPNTKKITNLNPEEIQHMAHALKGTAATVGAEEIAKIADAMDKTCRQGKLPPEPLMHSLEKALVSAEYEIRSLLSFGQDAEEKAPLPVNEEEGLKALELLLATLQQSELADDALLDTALGFIKQMHGQETADKILGFIEVFDMDQAARLIEELILPYSKEF